MKGGGGSDVGVAKPFLETRDQHVTTRPLPGVPHLIQNWRTLWTGGEPIGGSGSGSGSGSGEGGSP